MPCTPSEVMSELGAPSSVNDRRQDLGPGVVRCPFIPRAGNTGRRTRPVSDGKENTPDDSQASDTTMGIARHLDPTLAPTRAVRRGPDLRESVRGLRGTRPRAAGDHPAPGIRHHVRQRPANQRRDSRCRPVLSVFGEPDGRKSAQLADGDDTPGPPATACSVALENAPPSVTRRQSRPSGDVHSATAGATHDAP